MAVSSERIAF